MIAYLPSLIFLDVDGVLNSEKSCIRFRTSRKLCPDAIGVLNRILRETGAGIVVSSTWRLNRTHDELRQILDTAGVEDVDSRYVAKTKDLSAIKQNGFWASVERGEEIALWIKENNWTRPFAILDDDNDMKGVHEHFFMTDARVGLQDDVADRVIRHLKREPLIITP